MIRGVVNAGEARIDLTVQGTQGRRQSVDALVNTGFTGWLSMPPSMIVSLGLRWLSAARGFLADGSTCLIDVYEADVNWDGNMRRILVDETNSEPLIGMSLLDGSELTIQVKAGGAVTIAPIP